MNGLESFINDNDFVFGSKNYDDDFHTDVLFYRASCEGIKEYIGDCHQKMIAFHGDFTSTFYYSRAKTKALCEKILTLLTSDDNFFNTFEEKYNSVCVALADCWEREEGTLVEAYKKQYACQKTMYQYCWPFEIIQTEFGIETEIRRRLQSQGLAEDEIENVLYRYELNSENVYYTEKLAIASICEKIKANEHYVQLFKNPLKHLAILLPPELRGEIVRVVEKYKYLYYHGFSDRKLPNLYDYLIKIKERLLSPAYIEKRLPMDDEWDVKTGRLLACYHKLSALKSIRRLAQLKNFYYLDLWIAKAADKLGVSEAVLRHMLPEEVIAFCETGARPKDVEQRVSSLIYVYDNGREVIISGEKDRAYYETLIREDGKELETVIRGKVACRGYVKGRVLKVLRCEDAVDVDKDTVIFTHEGDPDLLPVLKKAGAIVCEQGGITCHMAIIAREYGIPCIIGVGNCLINRFKNGEIVEVDAVKGYLQRSKL